MSSEPPRFAAAEADGREVLVDLSAAGEFGDFACTATDADIERIPADVNDRTNDLTRTTVSENNVDTILDRFTHTYEPATEPRVYAPTPAAGRPSS